MQTPQNEFKLALAHKKAQIGLWLGLADPYCAELCAGCGFDWVLIDGEHAPNDLRSMLSALQAVAAYPVHPVVRIPEGTTTLIKQVLEIGASTILVPMVETADEAQRLAQAIRYPPLGVRGVGSGLARSSRWNAFPTYLKDANERACLLVQVETEKALGNIDAIAGVDGVDGVFIGPADLAASMGYLGQTAHPAVRARIEMGIRSILAAGKAPGILCTDVDLAQHYLAIGAIFVAVGVDTTLLASAGRTLSARFRKVIPETGARGDASTY